VPAAMGAGAALLDVAMCKICRHSEVAKLITLLCTGCSPRSGAPLNSRCKMHQGHRYGTIARCDRCPTRATQHWRYPGTAEAVHVPAI
jgi:hypothetical protein